MIGLRSPNYPEMFQVNSIYHLGDMEGRGQTRAGAVSKSPGKVGFKILFTL